MFKKTNPTLERYLIIIYLALAGLLVGVVVGGIDAVFGIVLVKLNEIRDLHFTMFIPFLAPIGLLIVYVYKKIGGKIYKGVNLVFEVGYGDEEVIPKRFIPLLISGTWLTHLFGGSAGREGVAVQIGAAFSNWVGRKIPFPVMDRNKIFLVTGIAAGFAGLFGTPIAAIFFAMEVLVAGTLRYQALLPAIVAAFTASHVSQRLGLQMFTYNLSAKVPFDLINLIKISLLGILFGLVGWVFANSLKYIKKGLIKRFPNPYMRIGIIGLILSLLFFFLHKGRYSGLSTSLMIDSFNGGNIYAYDWILKLLLTATTLSIGFQGGEVAPMFIVGATLGVVIAKYFNLPVEFVAAMGYVGVFGSGTNTFLAPVFVGGEIFGFEYIPYFFIVCSFAYIFNMNKSIYSLQRRSYNIYQFERD